MENLYGGIEAGGTSFVCAVGTASGRIVSETSFGTTSPVETIAHATDYFLEEIKKYPLKAIGIGSFGTIDIDPVSSNYGHIKATPKNTWENTDFVGIVARNLNIPVYFDTDVNLAALAEHCWGTGRGVNNLVYMTVGTGIGGGGIINGERLHGLIHPEMGHIRIPHDWNRDPFPGICPFHEDCLEGLASAPAIERRWEQSPETLPADHQAWLLEADYLAMGTVNLICIVSPELIVMGGGIMKQRQLFPMIRHRVQKLLNQYILMPEIIDNIDKYIVPPVFGDRTGVLGAIALASQSFL